MFVRIRTGWLIGANSGYIYCPSHEYMYYMPFVKYKFSPRSSSLDEVRYILHTRRFTFLFCKYALRRLLSLFLSLCAIYRAFCGFNIIRRKTKIMGRKESGAPIHRFCVSVIIYRSIYRTCPTLYHSLRHTP